MNLTCYNSSEPVAVNATLLYDYNDDNHNLWSRPNASVPLSSCSSPHPPDSPCMVCQFTQVVFAVCRNLSDGVRMMMEAAGQQVTISESDCPGLVGAASNGDGDSPGDHGDAGPWWLAIVLPLLLLLLLLLAVLLVVFYKRWKRQKSPKTLKGRTDAVDPSEEEPVNEAAV